MSRREFRYDVALSFAGEDRECAESVAEALRARKLRVFYDKWESKVLWGKNLYQHLSNLYQNEARYCIIFISRKYAEKLWTKHELQAAQARALEENQEYILPLRLDDTEVPGLSPVVAYLSWGTQSPEEIAEAVHYKLSAETLHGERVPKPQSAAQALPEPDNVPRRVFSTSLARQRSAQGEPYPLGATYDGSGTNFSLFSEVAERVELCLFDEAGRETRILLPEVTAFCWHGYLPDIGPGQRYGFRVHGPWNPAEGHRCNPNKLLLDPYAKAVEGRVEWNEAVFPYRFGDLDAKNDLDSAPFVPKSVVIDPGFDWSGDTPPRTPNHETVLYEVHVKGFTKRHPDIPSELRGTYAGLAHPAAIAHLKRLGITAVELMPVHHFVHESHLLERGLRNYWGYNSIGYFAPHEEYAAADGDAGLQVREFKQMVKALHQEGIEVILDVVYNHTAEGNHLGPILSFKGLDNAAYYRLVEGDRRYYMDYTGTGNSLNMRHPNVPHLILDSLRYWVLEMHVDGFRFDLAATLARELHDANRLAAFYNTIQQDPVLNQVKLIAEPWDLGEGGDQIGNFPPLWSEWNGKYRDAVRDYWRGAEGTLAEFPHRFTGSSDLYASTGRRPTASINYVTAHDGFTLRDLVSYNEKRNEANGEGNRDGESHNRSWNCGVEGPTDNPGVNALRSRQQRNFLATLFLSQGIPMLLGGDEMGRTQQGNNNAWCQDNEISWFDWENIDEDLVSFTSHLIAFRRAHPVFRRYRWFLGAPIENQGVEDIGWFRPEGGLMRDQDWADGHARAVGVFLNGDAIPGIGVRKERVKDDSFYVLFNAHHDPVPFRLPERPGWGDRWIKVLDTSQPLPEDGEGFAAGGEVPVEGRAVVVLKRMEGEAGGSP